MNSNPNITEAEYLRNRAERQFKVAQLRLAGLTNQERMAKILGVSQATISKDMALIDSQLKNHAQQDLAVAKGNELERIERLIAGVWSKALGVGANLKDQLFAVDRVIKLIELKAKMLGLNAPVTVNLVNDEVKRLATEFGLDTTEIQKEAERILKQSQFVTAGAINEYAGMLPEMKEFE